MELAKTCLVIDSRKAEKVSLDGPALRIRMQAQSARLFPLRRLSRIHILGELGSGFDALVHCAEHQIPVAFFTVSGKLRCQLYFPVFENSILSHWLEHVEFDIAAQQHYEEWLLHQSLHLLSLMGCTQGARELRIQLTAEKLNHICKKQLGDKHYQLAMEWLSGMLNVHFSQIIVNHGLSNQSRGKRKLMEDLIPLYTLWLRYLLADRVLRKQFTINGYTMSNFYQEKADLLEYTARRMLTQLSTRLESII